MDRTTELMSSPVPDTILENYGNVHLDIDVLFVNKIPSLLATSRDIGFVHILSLIHI